MHTPAAHTNDVTANPLPSLGVDLGGTKIEIVALDACGRELIRRRTSTPRDDYAATLGAIVTLVEEAESSLGVTSGRCRLGIGTPGSRSRATGLMRNCNSQWLNGKPLGADLESLLQRTVVIANDANCFALSEATDGAGEGAESVFGVILGTGVGGGLVTAGRVRDGCNGIAGEFGHNAMPWPRDAEWPGPPCYCGRSGCIETFLSGPGFAADHARVNGAVMAPTQIVQRAQEGNVACEASLVRYEERLARALAHVINIVDPDVIVLGGGLSNMDRLYASVPAAWMHWVFSDRVDTRLSKHLHGDSSGVRGAARLTQR